MNLYEEQLIGCFFFIIIFILKKSDEFLFYFTKVYFETK
jgi:hypothetical protein